MECALSEVCKVLLTSSAISEFWWGFLVTYIHYCQILPLNSRLNIIIAQKRRCFPVNLAKSLKKFILKNICERLFLYGLVLFLSLARFVIFIVYTKL